MKIILPTLTILLIILGGFGSSAQAQGTSETCRKLRKLGQKNSDEVSKNKTNYDNIRKNYEEMLKVAGATNNRTEGCIVEYKAYALQYFKRYTEAYEMLVDWFGIDITYNSSGNTSLYSLTADSARDAAKADIAAGNYDAAIIKIANGLRAARTFSKIKDELYEVRGDAYAGKGDFKQAISDYKNAEKPEKIAQAEKQLTDKYINDTQAVKADGTPDYDRRIEALIERKYELKEAKKYEELVSVLGEIIKLSGASSKPKTTSSSYNERGWYYSLIARRDNSQTAANSCISDFLKGESLGFKISPENGTDLSYCYRIAGDYQKAYLSLALSISNFNTRARTENTKPDFLEQRSKFVEKLASAYVDLSDKAALAGVTLSRNQLVEGTIDLLKTGFCKLITGTWKRQEVTYKTGERGVQQTFVANDTLNFSCDANGKLTGTLDRSAKFSNLKGTDGIFGQEVSGSLFANISSAIPSKNGFFNDAQFSFYLLENGFREDTLTSTTSGDTYKITSSVGASFGLKNEYKNCSVKYSSKDGKPITTFICDGMKTTFQKQ